MRGPYELNKMYQDVQGSTDVRMYRDMLVGQKSTSQNGCCGKEFPLYVPYKRARSLNDFHKGPLHQLPYLRIVEKRMDKQMENGILDWLVIGVASVI